VSSGKKGHHFGSGKKRGVDIEGKGEASLLKEKRTYLSEKEHTGVYKRGGGGGRKGDTALANPGISRYSKGEVTILKKN